MLVSDVKEKVLIVTTNDADFPDLEAENESFKQALMESGFEVELMCWKQLHQALAKGETIFERLVFRTVWDYPQNEKLFRELLDILIQKSVQVINPAQVMQWNLDKTYLVEMQNAGLPVVPVALVEKGQLTAVQPFETVLKPVVGLGSVGIVRVEAGAQVMAPVRSLQSPFRKKIKAGELSVIIVHGEPVLHIRKTPSLKDWRVQPQYGGKYALEPDVCDEIKEKSMSTYRWIKSKFNNNLFLYMRIDFVQNDHDAWEILEFEAIDPSLYGYLSQRGSTALAQAIKMA